LDAENPFPKIQNATNRIKNNSYVS